MYLDASHHCITDHVPLTAGPIMVISHLSVSFE